MTEHYFIYKITNSVDDKVYIGSTKQTLKKRFTGHKGEARGGNLKKVSAHMRNVGIDKFMIEVIKEMNVNSRKEARIEENNEIEKVEKSKLLNSMRAYTYNNDKTRDQVKKRKNRRDFYHRHMKNEEWKENERKRNRERMRLKREFSRLSKIQI